MIFGMSGLARMLLAGLLLVCMAQRGVAAPSVGLQKVFRAAFGQTAPVMRWVSFPDGAKYDARLDPLILIHVGGNRYALIVTESFNGAHASPGFAAVAYVDRTGGVWRKVRVWYEVDEAGSFGTPIIQDRSYDFGGTPFFAGVGQYCGMGACTASYSLIGLYPDGPVNWGGLLDFGQFFAAWNDLPDGNGMAGCGGYDYSSVISPPATKGDLLRVTYRGWMLPGGGGQRRRAVEGSEEVFWAQGKLGMRPEVALPNCGQ